VRLVAKHRTVPKLEYTEAGLAAMVAYFDREVEDAVSARNPQEGVWREVLRQYDAVPRTPVRNVPIENAPNIEVPLGAIATDSVYAQIIDLIFNIQPILTVRAVSADDFPDRRMRAEALQEHINWGVANEWGLRAAADETILDDVKLGTGIFHIPFVESIRKTRVETVTSRGPAIRPFPVEDFFVPGGAYGDLQTAKWCAGRWWYTESELKDHARAEDWDISMVSPSAAIGWVRNRREMLGRTWRNVWAELFEIWRIWCVYDIDEDGIAEDLIVTWDRTSRTLLKVEYNGYDSRPWEAARYQLRGHLFYGIGVMDMCSPFQYEASEVHSYALANALLANARFWKGRDSSMPESMHIWPGKYQSMNDPDDLQAVQMADVYPSMIMMQGFPIQLSKERVGINEVAQPGRGAMPRTPGITAISLLSQANKRFTPAFDGVRLACAGAVRQCLLRESERLLAGDKGLAEHIEKIHGPRKGMEIVETLKDPDFHLHYAIELTASSTTINRDVERQNSILLVNILGQYYQRVLELVAIASNPQTPEPVRDAAKKIAEAAGAIIGRTLRTFDQVRDPEAFIVDVNAELDKAGQAGQQGMQMLMQMFAPMAGAGASAGALPSGITTG